MDKTKIHKMWIADQGDGTYTNPILYTDYSDPDAIRVGEDYFMIASSFCNTPAVPLLHSKDLVNWKVINYIIDKLPFDYYDKPVHGCGTWAPAIRYHEGTYYVFIPMPDEGIMMCKTTDPFGKWSEPAYVRKVVGWIDPCPFWDEDGKAYMVTAFARSRIGFKSMLYMSPIEPDCSGVLDDGQFIYDGHVDPAHHRGTEAVQEKRLLLYLRSGRGREARLADRTAVEKYLRSLGRERSSCIREILLSTDLTRVPGWIPRTDRTGSCISRMWAMQDVSFICSLCTGRMTGR